MNSEQLDEALAKACFALRPDPTSGYTVWAKMAGGRLRFQCCLVNEGMPSLQDGVWRDTANDAKRDKLRELLERLESLADVVASSKTEAIQRADLHAEMLDALRREFPKQVTATDE